jgi:hypothetical protein
LIDVIFFKTVLLLTVVFIGGFYDAIFKGVAFPDIFLGAATAMTAVFSVAMVDPAQADRAIPGLQR